MSDCPSAPPQRGLCSVRSAHRHNTFFVGLWMPISSMRMQQEHSEGATRCPTFMPEGDSRKFSL